MRYILPFGQAHGSEAWRSGAKAARLSALYAAGFPVPRGFAIASDALDRFLQANGADGQVEALLAELDAAPADGLGGGPARLRALVEAGALPADLEAEFRQALLELGPGPLSLRSSSTLEDRADLSFAGQHDSFLNLQSYGECAAALKRVWASLWSDRALSYLRALDRSVRQLRMGVLVQDLVPARVSGVSFTVHPLSGDYEQLLVSAAPGLGESTVSGQVAPDEVVIRRQPLEILSYAAGAKATKVVAAEGGGTTAIAVPAAEQRTRALGEEEALEVARLALRVEEFAGGDPQDVEWALGADGLFLLQARPLVAAAAGAGVAWESPIPGARWRRNWRLGEWLPDAVTPLFASWVLPKLVAARENFGTGRLGWEQRPSFSMPHPWFCLVNGYFYTRQNFSGRGGRGRQSEEERRRRMQEGRTYLRRWHGELLPAYVEHFQQHRRRDLAAAPLAELLDFVESLADEAGEIWYIIAPIGYGFEEMVFKPHYESAVPAEGRPHYSALFSGYPSRLLDAQQALYKLSLEVRARPDCAESLLSGAPLESLPAWLREAVAAYAAEYGHQLLSLDFYYPTLGEKPGDILEALRLFARHDLEDPAARLQRAAKERQEAVARALSLLSDQEARADLEAMIGYYQTNAAVREDANFYFQLGWPLMRAALGELAARLVAAGALAETGEVFFLEKDELLGAVAALERGEKAPSLQPLAAARQRTWEQQRRLDAPDVLGASGEPEKAQSGFVDDAGGRRLLAQGASPGRCRGRVRIIHPDRQGERIEQGEVLVTRAASPYLTPLMLVAGALIVEVGGGASHSSLVARELGLPAVVNATLATRVLTEGMLVEVDGTRGIVRLLD